MAVACTAVHRIKLKVAAIHAGTKLHHRLMHLPKQQGNSHLCYSLLWWHQSPYLALPSHMNHTWDYKIALCRTSHRITPTLLAANMPVKGALVPGATRSSNFAALRTAPPSS